MKILYITDQTYLHGGIEKVLSQKTNYLADVSGDDVIIVTYNQQGRQPVYAFSDKIKMLDLDINYEIGKSYFGFGNLKKVPKHIKKIKGILDRFKPEVVVSCSFGPDYYFLPFVNTRVPKIKEFHSTRHFNQIVSLKDRVLKSISGLVEKRYHALVLLNDDEIKFYKTSNYVVLPNPTELDNRVCKLDSEKIIAAGRISYQKNFEDLIKICAELFLNYPSWSLHIYGEDYLNRKHELLKIIQEHNMSSRIILEGVTQDLKETFLGHSIYAMSSNHETFPMVLLEAMSVGLPIVSYDCPTGPSRIITDENDGFIVPYKNLDIFMQKLEMLMSDQNLRKVLGANAKKNAERFEIAKVMAQWKNLFNQIISK